MPKTKNQKNGNLRGTPSVAQIKQAIKEALPQAPKPKTKNKAKTNKSQSSSMRFSAPPVTVGTSMRSMQPTITASGKVVRLTGREFVITLPENNQTNWYLSALIPIHPAYFSNTVLSNYVRSYQHWRCNGVKIHFITRQPTSANGEVLMTHSKNVSDAFYSYSSSSFMSRSLSSPNAVLGPIWTNQTLVVEPWKGSHEVDAFTSGDINDNIYGEVAVFTQSSVTDTCGYLVMDYDFSFENPMYTMHASSLPISTGPNFIVSMQDVVNPVINAPLNLTPNAVFSGSGSVWKVVLNYTGSTIVNTASTTLAALNTTQSSALTLVDGYTFYAVFVNSAAMNFYPTLSSALVQSTSCYIGYAANAASKNTFVFSCYCVQFASGTQTRQD